MNKMFKQLPSTPNELNNNPKIFLGAPVRNRAWILPRYIEGIHKQNTYMETCFILNDSEDNTDNILKAAGFRTKIRNFNGDFGYVRGQYSKKNLAILRNILLDEFLKSDCQYFLSIDTDIILPKNSVQLLVQDDKDIVSMLIKNSDTVDAHNIFINGKHVKEVPEGLFPVDMTGAVYLIKRRVIESGVKYAYHPLGEDIPFCNSAKQMGFNIYCDSRLRPIHVFKENQDLIAKTSKVILPFNLTETIRTQILTLLDTCINAVNLFILYLQKSMIDSALNLLQDIIIAINKIGEQLDDYKELDPHKIIEGKFNNIENSIGLILNSIQKDNYQIAIDEAQTILKNIVDDWKSELIRCL